MTRAKGCRGKEDLTALRYFLWCVKLSKYSQTHSNWLSKGSQLQATVCSVHRWRDLYRGIASIQRPPINQHWKAGLSSCLVSLSWTQRPLQYQASIFWAQSTRSRDLFNLIFINLGSLISTLHWFFPPGCLVNRKSCHWLQWIQLNIS